MGYFATDDLDDAFDATRAFLLPFDLRRWLRLAVVAFFVASAAGTNTPSLQLPFTGGTGADVPPGLDLPAPPVRIVAVVLAIAGLALLVGLLFAAVAAVMEFVLVESLATETVAVRRFFRKRFRQGLRLFGFQLAVGLLVAVVAGGLVLVGLSPLLLSDAPGLTAAALILLSPFVLVAVLGALVVNWLTTAFVVPTMIAEDLRVLDGWRRFWPVLRANPVEYLAFALVYAAIVFVAGIAIGIGAALGAVVLAIPFGILGAISLALASVVPPVGVALLVVVVLAFAVSVLVVVALVQVPLVTYLRYYALFVLGDTDADLDLVAERRAAVRAAE